jgi:methionyl-tRNA formyltransferase
LKAEIIIALIKKIVRRIFLKGESFTLSPFFFIIIFIMRIVFMGTPNAAVAALERILRDGHEVVAVYTQPDKPAGRGKQMRTSPVKDFALENNLKIYQPTKIKTADALEEFKSHNADVAVVVAYGRILPETFLQAFPKGAINVHFSLLPKYRGAAPVNWAIVAGETKSGVTTMQMDAGLDTGAILFQRETEISFDETAPELMNKLSILGADLLSETLAMYNELTAQPQNESEASFAPIMKKDDGLIQWTRNASDISNRVRGFQPFPTAFTFYKDKKLTIWKCQKVEDRNQKSEVGKILDAKSDKFLISCGEDTVLQIDELQLEGKRRMSVKDFLNGIKIHSGEKLG